MTSHLVMLLCLASAPLPAADEQPAVQPAAQADRPKESRQAERLKQLLKQYPDADANRDGVLTREETLRYREQLRSSARRGGGERRGPSPTHSDVKYGPHARNVFDLWIPETANADKKLPVYVYFHGGGFVSGDKSSFDPTNFLDSGLAVVSANYRLVDGATTLSPAPLVDSARVIQFLRSKAGQWNLDPDRIAVSGSSAGAVISMWIGYHDDLADPDSEDPIARLSSRVRCIVPLNGPTNLDPRWITKNLGGPPQVHGSFAKLFGAPVRDSERPEIQARILESSPVEHVSADDPPSLLIYAGGIEGIPLPESASTGLLIHHAWFGKALKERLDQVGVVNRFLPGTDPRKDGGKVILDWLRVHLLDDK